MKTFPELINDLEALRITQREIAEFVGSKPSNISAIKNGTTPNWYLGEKLRELHSVRCQQETG